MFDFGHSSGTFSAQRSFQCLRSALVADASNTLSPASYPSATAFIVSLFFLTNIVVPGVVIPATTRAHYPSPAQRWAPGLLLMNELCQQRGVRCCSLIGDIRCFKPPHRLGHHPAFTLPLSFLDPNAPAVLISCRRVLMFIECC